jgi:hypothetical protein
MRAKFLYVFLFIVMIASCTKKNQSDENKEEISIYDKNGVAIAYCNYSYDNECIIYLWNGRPTSYFIAEETELYGFNGRFLGWKQSGIYYDLDGNRIAFEKDALAIATLPDPDKSIKEILPVKSIREHKPIRPVNSIDWSNEPLDSFLIQGRE